MEIEFRPPKKQTIPINAELEAKIEANIHYFCRLKRLWTFQQSVGSACEGKEIYNDLLYFDVLFGSFESLVVRLVNFTQGVKELLNDIRETNLGDYKRNRAKTFQGHDRWEQATVKEHFEAAYDRVFPAVKDAGKGRPSAEDIEVIREHLTTAMTKVKALRDTSVAHWDKNPAKVTFDEIESAIEHLQLLLSDLYYLATFNVYLFELGGVAADANETAEEFVELVLKTNARARIEADMQALEAIG